MFKINSPTNIVATILAKNEEDIIGINIEHLINQGVKHIIITDNDSTDKTKLIAEKYPEVKEIIHEKGDNHNQSEWVTRMARMACKFNPDWIIHVDADELWCGLSNLSSIDDKYISSHLMLLHPPVNEKFSLSNFKNYIDLCNFRDLPGECKVAHRPDKDIIISHGNHGYENRSSTLYTNLIWRHHYPIRSFSQFRNKAVNGHLALAKRNATCERWHRWYQLEQAGRLKITYDEICNQWESMVSQPSKDKFLRIIEHWCEKDVIEYFRCSSLNVNISSWPNFAI